MDQEATGGGFVPTPFEDLLRPDAGATRETEPAGRQEPIAPAPEAPRETGEAAAPAPEAMDGRLRDPATGKFIPKAADAEQAATGSPPAEQQKQPPQMVPASVLAEERRKWQAKVREMEARYSAPPPPQPMQMPQQQQAAPPQDFWADPEGYFQHRETALMARVQQEMVNRSLATTEAIAKAQPDYEEAVSAMEQIASVNPAARQYIAQQLNAQPAPALWAYEEGKKLLAQQKWAPVVQQHADPEAYVAAEVERRLAERAAQMPAPSPAPQPPPASLASARSAGPRSGPGKWTGPTPTTQIWGRR